MDAQSKRMGVTWTRRSLSFRRLFFGLGAMLLAALVLGGAQAPPSTGSVAVQTNPALPSSKPSCVKANSSCSEAKAIFVQVAPATKSKQELAEEADDRRERASSDQHIELLTFGLVVVGLIQAWVFWVQAGRLKATVIKMDEISKGQTADTAKSIAEAGRAAAAMERVATSIAANVVTTSRMAEDQRAFWALQMRAYVVVNVGDAVYQETSKNLKFEGKAQVINVGATPAYNFRRRVKAKVLNLPIPDNFSFDLPAAESISANTLGPRQDIIVSSVVEETLPDDEVAAIKAAKGRVLCLWGVIEYQDMSGEPHFTNFCQLLTWAPNGKILGYYHTRHNDSN
jgi:hypothetical protein